MMMKCKRLLILYTVIAFMFLTYMVAYLQIENPEVKGWGYNMSRDPTIYIPTTNRSAQLLPEHFCDRDTFLMVMVCSSPANFAQRLAIRQTWSMQHLVLGKQVSIYFLLGETTNDTVKADVIHESETYGDVIQERFIDSYNNLTLKTIFMLKLVGGGGGGRCANPPKYLFKIDDDMYVNMELLVRLLLLQRDHNDTDLLMGKLICKAKPITNINSKWYSPPYMYPGAIYPNYLSGTGYVMSASTARKLYATALQTPILHLEDVYTTGICAAKVRIKPRNNPLFTYHKMAKDPCTMRKLCTMHHFTPREIREMHENLTNTSLVCHTSNNNGNNSLYNVNKWLLRNVLKTNKTLRKNKCD